jgi:hypothetical protein
MLAAINDITDEAWHIQVLMALASNLSSDEQADVYRKIKNASRGPDDIDYVRNIVSLAYYLPDLLPDALKAIRTLRDDHDRARMLVKVVQYLSQEQQPPIFQEALDAARTIHDENDRTEVLKIMAPYLHPLQEVRILQEALYATGAILPERFRLSALEALAPQLPYELRLKGLEMIRTLPWEFGSEVAAGIFMPDLTEEQQIAVLQSALTFARTMANPKEKADALTDLVLHFPQEQQSAILQETLTTARAIGDGGDRVKALNILLPHFPQEQQSAILEEELAHSRAIGDGRDRVEALNILLPHFPQEQQSAILEEELAHSRAIGDGRDRVEALNILLPHFPQEQQSTLVEEIYTTSCTMMDEDDLSRTLGQMASFLSTRLLTNAITTSRSFKDSRNRAILLSALAPYLPYKLLIEAIVATRAIEEECIDEYASQGWLLYTLADLALYLPQEEQLTILQEVFVAVQTNTTEHLFLLQEPMVKLVPFIPSMWLPDVLKIVYTDDFHLHTELLVNLAPRLPEIDQSQYLWQTMLPMMARRDRPKLLSAFAALTPWLETLATPDDLAAIAQSIVDVSRCWP